MAKKKSKHRRVDFSTYKPLYDRKFNPAYMEEIQDSLIARNYAEPQRVAILSNVLHETGGDPTLIGPGGFRGIVQWGEDRYPNTKKLNEQITELLNTSENVKTPNWSDGGGGSPTINTAKEAYDTFWNSKDPYEATLYYTKGYVRPKDYKARTNRAEEAANMAKNSLKDGGPTGMQAHRSNPFDVNAQLPMDYWLNLSNPNTQMHIGAVPTNLDMHDNIIRNASKMPSLNTANNPLPNKIDVKVGGKSLAEGPLTNQELGIKPKTDWNSVASVASAAMPVVDSVINPKKNTTTAGNIMQGIGGAVSMINPVVGLAIQGAGMLTNAAFGSNIDDSKVKAYETQADAIANTTFGGSTNAQLLSQYQAMTPLDALSKGDIGSEGWFSDKATNKVNELNKEREAANTRMLANFDLAVNNLEQQNLMYDMANYAKYGGKLLKKSKKYLGNKYGDGGTTNLAVEQPGLDWMDYWYSQRADIFKDNLEAATGSEFSKEASAKILNSNINRAKDTPSVIVSRKTGKLKQKDTNWKYEQETNPYFNKWSSEDKEYNKKRFSNPGLKGRFIENDDSRGNYIVYPEDVNESTALHEQLHAGGFSPAVEAIRRKADEGWEANDIFRSKFNNPDYVYQPEEIYARLGQLRQALKLDPTKSISPEDISKLKNTYRSFENDWWNKPKTLPDNYEEVKNLHILDAFSPKDLEYLFNNVADNSNSNVEVPEQMDYINPYEEVNMAAEGGPLFNEFSNGITKINEGGSHSENPYGGIQVGVDPEGIPNLVEEGEVIFNDYVFSNRLVVPDKVRTKYKLRKSEDVSFADAANEIQKMSEEMPNDPIVKRTMETQMQELMMEQEQVRMKKDKNKRKNKFAKGGIMSPLEYIEPALSVGQGIQSLFIEPDYSHLDAYEDAINAANIKVSSSPVKTNMRYTPMDTRGLLSEASANRAATNRALMNTSGANPAIARTALTNADYNYNNQLGKLWRSIEEAEYNRQLGFEQFRTNLENANRARDLQVAGINADILAKQAGLRGDFSNKQLAIDKLTSEVKSGNIDAAEQSLAGLARQDTYSKMLQMLKDEGYFYNPEKYKDLLARLDALEGDSKKKGNSGKYGGRIKRKRRLS